MLRTGESHDPEGRLSSRYDAGLSTDAGDQLPGSLATTRTGLTPAGDGRTYGWTTSITSSRPNLLGTLPSSVELSVAAPLVQAATSPSSHPGETAPFT